MRIETGPQYFQETVRLTRELHDKPEFREIIKIASLFSVNYGLLQKTLSEIHEGKAVGVELTSAKVHSIRLCYDTRLRPTDCTIKREMQKYVYLPNSVDDEG